MSTVKTLIAEARQLILDGKLDEAKAKKDQAEALKALEGLDTPEVKGEPAARLPFDTAATPTPAPDATKAAVAQAVYVKKYGDFDAATGQVIKELYGTDNYGALYATKMYHLNRYLRHGILDERAAKSVLLAPSQIMSAVALDVPVADGNYTIKATMVEAQDQLGGFLVPEQINMDMVQRLPGLTVVRQLARKYPTSRDRLIFMVRRGGTSRFIGNVRSKQTSEAPSSAIISESNALFGRLEIPVHVNLTNVPVSKSLLEDSAIDILSDVLMPEFTAEAAVREDGQFLTGTGVNEPQGILNGTAANNTPFNTDVLLQNAAAGLFDGIVQAPFQLAGQYRAKNNPSTAWVFNASTAGAIAVAKSGQGEYLWREMYGNNAAGVPDTLRGWKVMESEALPAIAASTYGIIFGDFSGYRIVDRVGMSVERYSDSNTAQADSVIFYMRRRYGGQVAEGYRFVAIRQ